MRWRVLKKNDLKSKKLYILFTFIASSMAYAISVSCFIDQSGGNIIPAGISGIAMFLSRVFFVDERLTAYMVIYIIFNIPLFILAYKTIGKIFSILTFCNVVVTSVAIAVLGKIGITNIPIFSNIGELEDIMLVLCAGSLTGLSVGLALVANFSTGGTDIVTLYFGIKKGKSIGRYLLILNIGIILISGIYNGITDNGWNSIIYTTLYIGVSSTVVDLIFTRTKKVMLEVVSNKGSEIAKYILEDTHHSCTILDAVGAYTNVEKKMLHLVVSFRQVKGVVADIKLIDEHSFIIQIPVDNIYGLFYIPPFK